MKFKDRFWTHPKQKGQVFVGSYVAGKTKGKRNLKLTPVGAEKGKPIVLKGFQHARTEGWVQG